MKQTKILAILILTLQVLSSYGQTYQDEINSFREKYKQEFIDDANSPLKKEDLEDLHFFEANETYRINAIFQKTENAKSFDLPTMNGSSKKYIEYGILSFKIGENNCTLKIYQSVSLMAKDEYKDYLFVPFTDKTNGHTSYGGGRYLDFKTGDIKGGKIIIDFNKAYNPYCAYSSGYSCPKPPNDNALQIAIPSGEQAYGASDH